MPDKYFTRNPPMAGGEKMISLSHGMPAELAPRPSRVFDRVQPPADGFRHDDKLNMGPAIWLAVILSLLGWAAVIGAAYLIRPLI
jgi:hypothetical protein